MFPRMTTLTMQKPPKKPPAQRKPEKRLWAQEMRPVKIRPNGFHEDITFLRDKSRLTSRDVPLCREAFKFKGQRVANLGPGVDSVTQYYGSADADVPLASLVIKDYGIVQSDIEDPLSPGTLLPVRCAFSKAAEGYRERPKLLAEIVRDYKMIGDGVTEIFGLTSDGRLDVERAYDKKPNGELVQLHVVSSHAMRHGIYLAKPNPQLVSYHGGPFEFTSGAGYQQRTRRWNNAVMFWKQHEDGTYECYNIMERYEFDALYKKVGNEGDHENRVLQNAKEVLETAKTEFFSARRQNYREMIEQWGFRLRYLNFRRWQDPNPPAPNA